MLALGLLLAVGRTLREPVRQAVLLDLLSTDPCDSLSPPGTAQALPGLPPNPQGEGGTALAADAPTAALVSTVRLPAAAELILEVDVPERPGEGSSSRPIASATFAEGRRGITFAADGPGRWRGQVDGATAELARVEIEVPVGRLRRAVLVGRQASTRAPLGPDFVAPIASGADRGFAELSATLVEPARPLNVLLYVIDTARADHFSLYGYDRPTTPELEALAAEALVFERAYSPGPSTLGSIPALLSSIRPSAIPVRVFAREKNRPTLAEVFAEAGYRRAAFLANPVLQGRVGFQRGFETFELLVPPVEPGGMLAGHDAQRLHRAVLEWLDVEDRAPFFLWVQSFDLHHPYERRREMMRQFPARPRPLRPRAPRRLSEDARKLQQTFGEKVGQPMAENPRLDPSAYDASLAYADRELSQLLDELDRRDLLEETIVVVTSDHGEALGNLDDGTFLHGHSLYEELVHVPLLIRVPGVKSERVMAPTSLIDLAPVLLAAAGAGRQAGQGTVERAAAARADLGGVLPRPSRNLASSVPVGEVCPPIATGQRLAGGLAGGAGGAWGQPVAEWFLREGRWKLLVEGVEPRLFDLEADPRETHDVALSRPLLVEHLLQRGRARGADGALDQAPGPSGAKMQRALEPALRALAYIE